MSYLKFTSHKQNLTSIYELYIIHNVTKNRDEKLLEEFYQNELKLTENCLKQNPKSYWVWYQRIWITNHLAECNWKKELMLCTKCLNLDDRNCESLMLLNILFLLFEK